MVPKPSVVGRWRNTVRKGDGGRPVMDLVLSAEGRQLLRPVGDLPAP